ncbi:hypothetical protein KP509_13G069900 [Ceratopteris richardii]|uniref:Uncharacterized protein n=1 Tax=Ceratopteris richardii TaxID=49495 RepID=A0A8T2TIL2_CERRI|nr:hypothetical protein KP509_13G069900 [Ceratopteris richardii]
MEQTMLYSSLQFRAKQQNSWTKINKECICSFNSYLFLKRCLHEINVLLCKQSTYGCMLPIDDFVNRFYLRWLVFKVALNRTCKALLHYSYVAITLLRESHLLICCK